MTLVRQSPFATESVLAAHEAFVLLGDTAYRRRSRSLSTSPARPAVARKPVAAERRTSRGGGWPRRRASPREDSDGPGDRRSSTPHRPSPCRYRAVSDAAVQRAAMAKPPSTMARSPQVLRMASSGRWDAMVELGRPGPSNVGRVMSMASDRCGLAPRDCGKGIPGARTRPRRSGLRPRGPSPFAPAPLAVRASPTALAAA